MNFKTIFTILLNILFPRKGGGRSHELALLFSPHEVGILLYSLFTYKDPAIRSAIWQLKYHKNEKVAENFASSVHSFLIEEVSDLTLFYGFNDPIVVPMPISTIRRCERGYNQCEILLNHLQVLTKDTLDLKHHVLIKTKDTPRQTTLDRRHRLENIRGCFSITETSAIKDRNIILIDDVVTTGSTVEEARTTLFSGGARKVVVIALAH